MNAKEDEVVDHVNHDTLDNIKGNLRIIPLVEERMVIMEVIGIIVCIIVIVLICKSQDNSMPKDGYETDHRAMMHDINSGKSKYEIRGKYYSGGYNVPKKKKE